MDKLGLYVVVILANHWLTTDSLTVVSKGIESNYVVLPESYSDSNNLWGGYSYTLAECQAFCDDRPDCVAFAYKQECIYSELTCYPKSGLDDVTTNLEGWHIFKKDPSDGTNYVDPGTSDDDVIIEYRVTPDSDCAGNDKWGGYTYSLKECQDFCDQHPDCVAVVYRDMCVYTEHTCWPKSSCDGANPNDLSWNIYRKHRKVKPVSPSSCGLHARFDANPGYALYGYDDEVMHDVTEPACARKCMMMRDACLSFDYNNCTNTCALSSQSKDTVVTLARHRHTTYYHKVCVDDGGNEGNPDEGDEDNGTDTDTDCDKGSEVSCTYESFPGHALFGHNDHIHRGVSLSECTDQCDQDQLCLSFDYSSETGSCFISYSSRLTAHYDYGKHSRMTYYEKQCGDSENNGNDKVEGSGSGGDSEEGSSNGDYYIGGMDEGSTGGEDYYITDDTDHYYQESIDIDLDRRSDRICLEKLGPYGGPHGNKFSDRKKFLKHQGAISQIQVHHGDFINCLGFTYGRGEQAVTGHCRGGTQGELSEVDLAEGEYITGIKARTGLFIDQLTIVTNLAEYGPYGGSGGDLVTGDSGGKQLAYISGHSGVYLDQLMLHFYC